MPTFPLVPTPPPPGDVANIDLIKLLQRSFIVFSNRLNGTDTSITQPGSGEPRQSAFRLIFPCKPAISYHRVSSFQPFLLSFLLRVPRLASELVSYAMERLGCSPS